MTVSPRIKQKARGMFKIRWLLLVWDIIFTIAIMGFFFIFPHFLDVIDNWQQILYNVLLYTGLATVSRFLWRVYNQIWRYGGVQSYMRLIIADGIASLAYFLIVAFVPSVAFGDLSYRQVASYVAVTCLILLFIRMFYRYLYKKLNRQTKFGHFVTKALNALFHCEWDYDKEVAVNQIKIAIIGAGKVGTGLANELLNNISSSYEPVCFVDIDQEKTGREIFGLPVFPDDSTSMTLIKEFQAQEVVFALPNTVSNETRKELYDKYKKEGFKIKSYDYPAMQTTGKGKRSLRDFDIEELLFREEMEVVNNRTINYYKNKTVLITGGGGSIGSEIARQIAKMEPKQLILLDIYENGVYDIQQELKIQYGKELDLQVEIVSICNKKGLEKVFQAYKPNIVIMAAAHKHVPLMEHNVVEAVDNNVFGTLNTVLLSEKYGADRVHMVSTDKAVNPTNVMGATKRMCEMIVMTHSAIKQHTTFSATRFGNVLGSAGSVIPLFKKQIANGGPITLTDKRIIRYFMTIPEASQLVLHSATIAKNGELMVLDMGQPVKIYELAVNIIKLSGYEPDKDIKIVETGLRPGEKLYEELLVKSETLRQTSNKKIFIEKDDPLSLEELNSRLKKLEDAMAKEDDEYMKQVMKEVVPTYVENDKVNGGGVKINPRYFKE